MNVVAIIQTLLDNGMTQEQLASALEVTQPTISRWLSGQDPRGETRDKIFLLAREKGLQIDKDTFRPYSPNARIGPITPLGVAGDIIPVYGQAIGGRDGRFVLNGNKIADIMAPPDLIGVPDAYAVYVVGESVEPRYSAGETVYVNPHMPVRAGNWVVVQVRDDSDEGTTPAAYIKQFVSRDDKRLKLRQTNPAKHLEFPVERVISIHKIVGTATP